jgi:hypothetical protein
MRKRQANIKGVGQSDSSTLKVRLYPDEIDVINNLRSLWNVAVDKGINPEEVKHGWIKDDNASLFIKNHNYKDPETAAIEKSFAELLDQFKTYSPVYPTIVREKSKDAHLLVVDPADIHIGKLCRAFETGQEYNSQIAVKRVKDGVQGLLNKSQGFDIDKVLLVIGNDILHTDTPKRVTTSGTPQDTDGMWYDNFLDGVRLYVDLIEILMQVADVHVTFNPSNHDYTSGFYLAQLIATHFRQSDNITFDVSISHRKYFTYGFNLIGSTHGDGAKTNDLPLLMAHEAIDWGKCKHRYIYTHHVHHKTAKDIMSVCVESLRSPSGADSWHYKQGYIHAPLAVEGFLHHPIHGQIARLTHLF